MVHGESSAGAEVGQERVGRYYQSELMHSGDMLGSLQPESMLKAEEPTLNGVLAVSSLEDVEHEVRRFR